MYLKSIPTNQVTNYNPLSSMENCIQHLTEDISLEFEPEVEAAIAELLPSDDPLQSKNFSVIDYINTIFPTEQSLSNIDDVVRNVDCFS